MAEGDVVEGSLGINDAAYYIHSPVLAARPDAVCAAHTHTPYGTAFSALVEPFRAVSQESTAFVFNQSIFDDEELDIYSTEGGHRIGEAVGSFPSAPAITPASLARSSKASRKRRAPAIWVVISIVRTILV